MVLRGQGPFSIKSGFANKINQALRQGDSGSWVVHCEAGKVFGHIIASTESYAFLAPLSMVFDQLDQDHVKTASQDNACLPPVFDCLADLAKHCYKNDSKDLAAQYATEAIQEEVLHQSRGSDKSRGSHSANIVEKFFVSSGRSQDAEEFLSAMLKRTGADLVAGLVRAEEYGKFDSTSRPGSDAPLTVETARVLMNHLSSAAGLVDHQVLGQPDPDSKFIDKTEKNLTSSDQRTKKRRQEPSLSGGETSESVVPIFTAREQA